MCSKIIKQLTCFSYIKDKNMVSWMSATPGSFLKSRKISRKITRFSCELWKTHFTCYILVMNSFLTYQTDARGIISSLAHLQILISNVSTLDMTLAWPSNWDCRKREAFGVDLNCQNKASGRIFNKKGSLPLLPSP